MKALFCLTAETNCATFYYLYLTTENLHHITFYCSTESLSTKHKNKNIRIVISMKIEPIKTKTANKKADKFELLSAFCT